MTTYSNNNTVRHLYINFVVQPKHHLTSRQSIRNNIIFPSNMKDAYVVLLQGQIPPQ